MRVGGEKFNNEVVVVWTLFAVGFNQRHTGTRILNKNFRYLGTSMFGGLSSRSQMDRDRSQTDAGPSSVGPLVCCVVVCVGPSNTCQEPLDCLVLLVGGGELAGELA